MTLIWAVKAAGLWFDIWWHKHAAVKRTNGRFWHPLAATDAGCLKRVQKVHREQAIDGAALRSGGDSFLFIFYVRLSLLAERFT